ncbi:MAG: TonB-dependent receptor [Bacteroidetes bacterium]|nr:TonB-dependent receptor [Bacteroidota bacterium]
MKFVLLSGFILLLSIQSFGQSDIIISETYNNLAWADFVQKIEMKYDVHFFYYEIDIPKFNIAIRESSSLKKILNENLDAYNIAVSIDRKGNIFLTKGVVLNTSLPSNFFSQLIKPKQEENEISVDKIDADFLKTINQYAPKTIVVGTKKDGVNKKNVTLSGYTKNSKTGEIITGSTIMDEGSKIGVAADDTGFFQITLEKGKHILVINGININEKRVPVELLSNGTIELLLEEKIYLLDDVVIRVQRQNKVKGTQMGIESLSSKAVKNIPLVFGEKDVMKIALLLPGVQAIGEGSAGFNVRGSPTDQNLFYINNVPIYNTSHASGFFSSFNTDAIDEFSLYKSNIPIKYGGRLSSIFDIKTKQGREDKTTANGGISLITGRVLVEGPIKEDKSSFLIGMRSTYSDWAIDMMFDDQDIEDSKANFADFVGNLSFQLNKNNLLNVFAYYSYDKMKLVSTNTEYDYKNIGVSANWKHFLKEKHTFELSLAHSIYDFEKEVSEFVFSAFKQNYKLEHSEIKANFNFRPNHKHSIDAGVNSILYQIDRGSRLPLGPGSLVQDLYLGTEKGLESGIYLGDEWDVTPKLSLNAGVRYNIYASLGPQKVYQYSEGLPMLGSNIQDSLFFDNNQIAKSYGGLDFRAAAKYSITDDVSVKVSYNRLHQYIYMLSNTIAVSPDYTWKLVDYNTKPIIGDQFSVGFFSNLSANEYEVSIEAYYKKNKNIVEIKDGHDFSLNKYIEQSTLQGDLKVYGVELMLKKNIGSLTGWINYTYSHTSVLIDSEFAENRINYGEPYPSNYDKPHALNLVANYDFARRHRLSYNIVYSTGRPITYPTSFYFQNGIKILNYSKRNEYRIPDYLRLDLSFTTEGNLLKNKAAHGSWTFSIYNVLGTNNPYSIYFKQEENKIQGYKLSIFAAPIVSLTYNFKLGNFDS